MLDANFKALKQNSRKHTQYFKLKKPASDHVDTTFSISLLSVFVKRHMRRTYLPARSFTIPTAMLC